LVGIRAPISALLLAVVSLTGGMGCEILATVDRNDIDQGFGGAGGQGGDVGAGGMGGSAGAGGGECAAAEECPGTDTDCQTRTCSNGVCGFEYAPSGTSTMDQTPGDCLTSVCDGMGGTTVENADADILDDGNPCTEDTCSAGQPSNAPLMAGAACSDGGLGKLCDGAGQCVECLGAADCSSQVCMMSQCVAESCADSVKNGAETDIDCGGAECAPCADAKKCGAATDCLSGVCKAGVCQAPTCSDKVKNGAETDADCGGSCSPCGPGLGCAQDADCVGGSCSGSMCLPTCTDQVKNANETDVDCGGPQCSTCPDGETCAVGSDCVSAVCSSGVCQASLCSDAVKNGAETDIDCGGPVCGPCGAGLACGAAADCSSVVCAGGVCAAATCLDAVKNGSESDIDCGGPDCVKCADSFNCGSGGDCLNGVCIDGECAPATCADKIKNGSETDVDCGGPCNDCAPLEGCSSAADCSSGICSNGTCQVPSCSDTVKNGAESDVDCGGQACVSCATGKACKSGLDCGSGICTNSVCAAPVCGDSIKGGAEQCDDGNVVNGDCCSSTCALEPACQFEVETNDTPALSLAKATFPVPSLIQARIQPVGEVDFFAIQIPTVMDVAIETFETWAPGTCPKIDTIMELWGPNGMTSLATDDDDGVGYCSYINPVSDLAVRQLMPGTYYVYVREYQFGGLGDAVIPAYSVKVTALSKCGNGIKEGYEVCDDGNQNNADACSNLCKPVTSQEVEPNNTCATANGPITALVGGSSLHKGAIAPVGDNDWFSFTLPATADVIFETFDANGPGGCAGIDTEIQVFKSDCVTPLGPAKDIGGIASCAKLNPTVDAQVRHLPAGKYYVRVNEYQNNATILGYTLQANITALCGNGVKEGFEKCDGGPLCDANCDPIPICGDGAIDAPETCDDGNTASNDGCSATCMLEPGFYCQPIPGGVCASICGDATVVGAEQCDDGNVANGDLCDSACSTELPPAAEVDPNDTFADADARASDPTPVLISGVSTMVAGAISPAADLDTYKVSLAADSVVRFEVFDGTGNDCPAGVTTTLTLFNAAQAQILTDNASGIQTCSAIVAFLPAGSYYVRVEETGNNASIAAYRLQVRVLTSVGAESEANETTATADPLGGKPEVFVLGSHQVNADSDMFAILVPPGRSLRAEIIEGSAAETCDGYGIDSRLTLYNPAGMQLVEDDNAGRGFCSLIDGTGAAPLHGAAKNLPGGTYYLQVRASTFAPAGAGGQFDYRLAISIR
jgi:cysteine-rich repeat protein